jgi:TusA-related sulfurtransferase
MDVPSRQIQIDLGSAMAPVSTLLAVKAFRSMQLGETLVIQNCNAETRQMILRCFPKSSYELLPEPQAASETREPRRILIRKTGHIGAPR